MIGNCSRTSCVPQTSRKPHTNKSYSKSHNNTRQEAASCLSYADVAKNSASQKDLGSRNKNELSTKPTHIRFSNKITKVGTSTNQTGYPSPKTEKPRALSKKLRLVPNPNTLDSRAPQLVRRGKEREKTSKEKETKLKRTILEARTAKSINTAKVVDKSDPSNVSFTQEQLEPCSNKSASFDENQQTKHSRKKVKYREYCDMYVTESINRLTERLLSDLMRFQERVRRTQPAKAKSKRRLVIGLKETTQCLQANRIKCVIIPPDIEPCPLPGGLDERLALIRNICTEKQVPIIYALSVHKIPKALGLPSRRHKTSAVGIYSYEGAVELFKQLVEESVKQRERWQLAHKTPLQDADNDTSQMENSKDENPQSYSRLSADAKPFIPCMFQKVGTVE